MPWKRFNLHDILAVAMVLFAIIDIVGAIPVIIEMRKKIGRIHSERATVAATVIMIVFLFLGKELLKVLGVDVTSFAIAGSFVIFFVALEMLLGVRLYKYDLPETASIVPLAFPLLAGTGTMTTLLALRAQYFVGNIVAAIVLNMVLVYAVLKNCHRIENAMGPAGVSVLRRFFGVILLAIAVKLFRANVGV